MNIKSNTVVALTWTMKDSMDDTLDILDDPVEFLVGGDDLLPAIDAALMGKAANAMVKVHIEPENGFGDFDEQLIFLLPRTALPPEFDGTLEVGMVLELASLLATGNQDLQNTLHHAPDHCVYAVTDIYPEHVVIDGNHPLAGISLELNLRVHAVREATVDEVGSGTAGVGFFKITP